MTTTTTGPVGNEFVHPALFYSDAQEYLDGTVPFIEEGLARGDPVAIAVPAENLQRLRTALGGAVERITMLDMAVAGRNPARIIPGVLRAFADAHPDQRVRIIGEPIWAGRSEAEYPACAQHEALINLSFAGRAATILCPYDTARLDEHVIADARLTHPTLAGTDGQRPSPDYDPHRIIDEYNRPLPPAPADSECVTVHAGTLSKTRRWLTENARHLGMEGQRLGDFELAAGELITNSVVHGGGAGVVRLWREQDRVVCDVSDAGHITDPLAGRRPTAGESGGRGLLIVNQLADLVRAHTTRAGTTVRIYMRTS